VKRALIAITGAYYLNGGIAAVNRLVIQALTDFGYSLDIFALLEKNQIEDRDFVKNEYVNYKGYRSHKVAFTTSIWKALADHPYDLIFIDHVNLASILAPLGRIKRFRYFVWLHGIEVFKPRPDIEGLLGLQFAWKGLTSSEFTRRKVLERFPNLPLEACELALDPVQYAFDLPILPKNGEVINKLKALDGSEYELGNRVLLHVARMDPKERYKGHEQFLKAFPIILDSLPGSQLVLVGDGQDTNRLKEIAARLPEKYRQNIFMPGFIDNRYLDQLFHSCYLFIMPSSAEGFGLVYLEAMAHGKPCIGGRLDATPFIVRDGVTGLLIDDPRSPQQVADKILELLSDPDRARQMGLAGYEVVRERYLFPHFKERFYKVIQS
jgi:phosphatidylinositol alpha-1,6-mannosyltransferase